MDNEAIYVAVNQDVRESKKTLEWTLKNLLHGKKICLLHVHIPFSLTSSSSRLDEYEINAIQESEVNDSYASLYKYRDICTNKGVREEDVDISSKLANNVEEGIVELIYENNIKKLVMGAAADSHYTEGMVHIRSRKAEYVSRHAPHCCKIWLVCNGNLIQTRKGRFDRVGSSNSSSESLCSLHGFDSALIPYEEPQRAEHDDTESIEDFHSARGFETMYYEEQRRILEIEELKREKERQDKAISTSSFGVTQILYNEEVSRRREAEKELSRAKEEIEKMKRRTKELEELLEMFQEERDEAVNTTEKLLRRLKLDKGESSSSSSRNSPLSPLQWSVSNEPPPYFICPISQEIMHNPHVAADGYTYEANEFKSWLSHGGVKSPMTNLKLDHHNLTPNIVLRTAIKDWLQQHPYFFDLS